MDDSKATDFVVFDFLSLDTKNHITTILLMTEPHPGAPLCASAVTVDLLAVMHVACHLQWTGERPARPPNVAADSAARHIARRVSPTLTMTSPWTLHMKALPLEDPRLVTVMVKLRIFLRRLRRSVADSSFGRSLAASKQS